ncbi:MAG TPA: YXWGXW repeat-containing protein, partial [Verrucomicrobiae bacterium]|nr:YXWGXW repeat-containing protein [Verrucomicrobiae bacterium]
MRISNWIGSFLLGGALFGVPVVVEANAPPAAQVAVSINIAPPILPVYSQPICPNAGYVWVPGYWAWGDDGYYWVPGTWVMPPEMGLLWTPGYWGFSNGIYLWNAGYWGPTVGFYGGINYGFGYPGTGFYGGYWRGNQYYYNTEVTNVDRTVIRNVYNTNVPNAGGGGHVSYNGGPHGVNARPTAAQLAASRERHQAMTSEQTANQRAASTNRNMLASVN